MGFILVPSPGTISSTSFSLSLGPPALAYYATMMISGQGATQKHQSPPPLLIALQSALLSCQIKVTIKKEDVKPAKGIKAPSYQWPSEITF